MRQIPDVQPPSKLSDLIDLAITDARRIDRSQFTPNYRHWVANLPSKDLTETECQICLAGAVMVGTLGFPGEDDSAFPSFAGEKWIKPLCALEAVRTGAYNAAFHEFHNRAPNDAESRILNGLPAPLIVTSRFRDWDSMDALLDTLEIVVRDLRAGGL